MSGLNLSNISDNFAKRGRLELPDLKRNTQKDLILVNDHGANSVMGLNQKYVSKRSLLTMETPGKEPNLSSQPYVDNPLVKTRRVSRLQLQPSKLSDMKISKHTDSGPIRKNRSSIRIRDRIASYEYHSSHKVLPVCDNSRDRSMKRKFSGAINQENLNDLIDKELNNVVRKIPDTELKLQDVTFKNLFAYPQDVIRAKLAKRMKELKMINPAHENIKLPPRFKTFILDVAQNLRDAISSVEDITAQTLLATFQLTESGDIFKGERSSSSPSGWAICITGKNEIVEGKFKNGKLVR